MTAFGVMYLASGVALGLWTLIPNVQGWPKRIHDTLIFFYVFLPVIDHRVQNDLLVTLGVLTVPLSFGWSYLRRKAFWSAGYVLCGIVGWLAWTIAVLSYRATGWIADLFLIGGFVLWFALAIVVPRQSQSNDPREAYEEAFRL